MSALRAGIIGLGVGEQHIAGYRAHPRCEVIALCDFDGARLREVGGRHPGVSLTQDWTELVENPDVDVVSVASYDSAHFEQVQRALERGKHVFAEKPLCLARDEAGELHRTLRARPELHLSSNLPLRVSPRFQVLREMIGAGRFGELFYLEGDYDYGRLHKLTEGWRGDLSFYSVFLGGAVHLVDLLLWLTGGVVERVSAVGNRVATAGTKFRFDDFVLATLEFEGGLVAKVSANFGCVHPHFHGVKVFGTEATFVNGLDHGTLYTDAVGGPVAHVIDAPYPGVQKGDLIHSFVDWILTGAAPEVSDRDVFATMAVCLAVEEARQTRQAVAVRGFD